jgi:hypothetical protein
MTFFQNKFHIDLNEKNKKFTHNLNEKKKNSLTIYCEKKKCELQKFSNFEKLCPDTQYFWIPSIWTAIRLDIIHLDRNTTGSHPPGSRASGSSFPDRGIRDYPWSGTTVRHNMHINSHFK